MLNTPMTPEERTELSDALNPFAARRHERKTIMSRHDLNIDEGQRQMLLMALAHLAVERPGWDYACSEIAKPIDNATPEGRPRLYDRFRAMHSEDVRISAETVARKLEALAKNLENASRRQS